MPCSNLEDVVISGISCRLPESSNMEEFRENLLSGIDMVTEDDRRWKPGIKGLPRRNGKLKDLSKFDATFFKVHSKQASVMNPQMRIMLEVTYEAIVDAGINPVALRGSSTGVFIAVQPESDIPTEPGDGDAYVLTGNSQNMVPNRLSFFFDFKGPSIAVDTACSSTMYALNLAMESIRNGHCEAAIVGGTNLCLNPDQAVNFLNLGVLSPEGKCHSFDKNADGYCRSEGIVAFYIQKEGLAKRNYCTVVHTKTNSDGLKEEGITFPSSEAQRQLLQSTYKEAGVNPLDITYLEAHATGTLAGDPAESSAITSVLCEGRQTPLLVGSVKSNMGHCESASGGASIAKVIVAMETNIIPANLHYNTPNENIPGLTNGQLKVVDRNQTWKGGLIGVNSFGFGGSNAHLILRPNCKEKYEVEGCRNPRLVVYGSRSAEGVETMLQVAQKHSRDLHFHRLIAETSNMPLSMHPYRGFTVVNSGHNDIDIQKSPGEGRPVWFVFSGMGSQWTGMGKNMMKLDVFRNSILKSDALLRPFGINLYDMIMSSEDLANNITKSFVGITSIQVALVDVLACIGVTPDGIVGHSVGELGCGYADGSLTAEEAVLAAYWRGHCVQNAKLPPGAMAAVGLTWEEALAQCPPGVAPACHNSEQSVTVSGPEEDVKKFVEQLQGRNVFAKLVNSAGVAFHSYFMKQVEESLRAALEKVIIAKPRTQRWISSSFRESDWSNSAAKMSSAEYHVHNLVSPVLFHEALSQVPSNAVVIEIAPHCLLQSILKGALSSKCCIVGLMKRNEPENMKFSMTALGKCYQNGVDLDPLKLFPPIPLPVPKGTPMISPLIGWDHTQSWKVPRKEEGDNNGSSFTIDTSKNSEYRDLLDHRVDGRAVMPATCYYVLAWRALAKREGKQWDKMSVMFEETKIHRPTFLSPDSKFQFDVSFIAGSDNFQVLHNGEIVLDGTITVPDTDVRRIYFGSGSVFGEAQMDDLVLTQDDVYKDMSIKGFEYGPSFRLLLQCGIRGIHGKSRWTGDWIKFVDSVNQFGLVSSGFDQIMPNGVTRLIIDPEHHQKHVDMVEEEGSEGIDVFQDNDTLSRRAGGVFVQNEKVSYVRRSDKKAPVHEAFKFVPYANTCPSATQSQNILPYAKAFEDLSPCLIENRNVAGHAKTQICTEALKTGTILNDETAFCRPNKDSHSLLKVLCEAIELPKDDKYATNIKALVERDAEALRSDTLITNLFQAYFLKPCLDIVWDNSDNKSLRFAEMFNYAMAGKIHEIVSAQPSISVSGFVATLDTATLERLAVKPNNTEVLDWEPGCKVPDTMDKFQLVVASNVVRKQRNIKETLRCMTEILDDDGFILIHEVTANLHVMAMLDCISRDDLQAYKDLNERTNNVYCNTATWKKIFAEEGFETIYEASDNVLSSLFLIRKSKTSLVERQTFLDISALNFDWLNQLQVKMEEVRKKPKGENLWLRAEGNISGIMGMVNSLRFEPGGKKLRYMFNMDGEWNSIDNETLHMLLRKDLVANVFKNGQWGCYRHLPLAKVEAVPSEHAYVNTLKKGDLSSLTWYQSPLRHDQTVIPGIVDMCEVHYSSLNFRDVMLASGKLMVNAIPGVEKNIDCLLGMEFSGKDSSGKRVMGMVAAKGLATTVKAQPNLLWPVPDSWTLEEAATVPVVYTTAYYALVIRANIRPHNSVLIHSGTGGVGQAAITIALNYGCKVYTTVGTDEKRQYLKERFPQLNDDCIFSSRDIAFENRIMKLTSGKGVDIVLNSLAGEKLFASLRIVAKHGKFLEIGKFDLAQNTALGMSIFLKNISFHGILTDALFDAERELQAVSMCFMNGIESGVVKPLKRTVFSANDVEGAFRYMAKGKHIGKVLIKVREDSEFPLIPAIPRSSFYPDKRYIITGGLGGFGLELAQWLVLRGVRHLVLTSRSGIKTGYQMKKLAYLRYNHGVEVIVSNKNVCDEDHVRQLLQNTDGRPVGGVFHLAVVMHDAILQNQTPQTFKSVCDTKVTGSMYLDEVTRTVCKDTLDWFVVFSSTASGFGNAGQSSYSFANSAMERIIEQRRAEGYPGLAIQWGPVGDVGVFINQVGDNDTVMGGTVPQRISSCLQSLDALLNQPEPIVCSYVLANQSSSGPQKAAKGLVDAVCKILGENDPSMRDENKSLGDMGVDSLLGVEIKLLLENDYNLSLSSKSIRELTLKRLTQIEAGEETSNTSEEKERRTEGQEEFKLMPTEQVLKLNSIEKGTPLFIVHSLYGFVHDLRPLALLLNVPVYGLQRTADVPQDSVEAMAAFYIQVIKRTCMDEKIYVAGYSFGTVIAQEIALQLQTSGHGVRSIILIDGTSQWIKTMIEAARQTDENALREWNVPMIKLAIKELQMGGFEDQIALRFMSMFPGTSEEEARLSTKALRNSTELASNYTPGNVYDGEALLVAAQDSMALPFSTADYGLHELCSTDVSVRVLPGDHVSILQENSVGKVADIINETIARHSHRN